MHHSHDGDIVLKFSDQEKSSTFNNQLAPYTSNNTYTARNIKFPYSRLKQKYAWHVNMFQLGIIFYTCLTSFLNAQAIYMYVQAGAQAALVYGCKVS